MLTCSSGSGEGHEIAGAPNFDGALNGGGHLVVIGAGELGKLDAVRGQELRGGCQRCVHLGVLWVLRAHCSRGEGSDGGGHAGHGDRGMDARPLGTSLVHPAAPVPVVEPPADGVVVRADRAPAPASLHENLA
jgi:hypothetical protein